MYLDETILQSRTTLSLVEFIDELREFILCESIDENMDKFRELDEKYLEIKEKAIKANKKRSFK